MTSRLSGSRQRCTAIVVMRLGLGSVAVALFLPLYDIHQVDLTCLCD